MPKVSRWIDLVVVVPKVSMFVFLIIFDFVFVFLFFDLENGARGIQVQIFGFTSVFAVLQNWWIIVILLT